MSALYDKNRREIRRGDVLKVFHFIGAQNRRHFMFKQVMEAVTLGKAKPEEFWKISHLDMTGAYYVELMDGRVEATIEIVQGIDAFWERDRPRAALSDGGSDAD